jgi:hypothetical protein
MRLIAQPVHLLPYSNSAVKSGNETNRILYHYIAAQTRISLLEPGIPDCRLPWVFSKLTFDVPDVGNSVKDDLSDHTTRAFPVV